MEQEVFLWDSSDKMYLYTFLRKKIADGYHIMQVIPTSYKGFSLDSATIIVEKSLSKFKS